MADNRQLLWFRRVTWLGIVANILVSLISIAATSDVLVILDLPPANPLIWPRFGAFLLILLSFFYIPAAIDPVRFRFSAWLAIICRFGGVAFFAIAGGGYIVFGLFDFAFGLPELILLTIGLRRLAQGPNAGPTIAPRYRRWLTLLCIVLVLGAGGAWITYDHLFRAEFPAYADDEENFKYGSIGNDEATGLPFLVWRALPSVFADLLPHPTGYASLGMVWEPGREHEGVPVGFSKVRIGFDRISINCALCHTPIARISADAPPRVYPGGASNTIDIFAYQKFLSDCARDPRFTPDILLPAMNRIQKLSLLDRLFYRYAIIPATRKGLLEQAERFSWTVSRPPWGPGRIDPFNPVKFGMLHLEDDGTIGNSVMQALWGVGARKPGTPFHWDGLNTSFHEVVVSSALGDGMTRAGFERIDLARIERYLLASTAPPSPFKPDLDLVQRGQTIFAANCSACHAPDGAQTLKVIALAEVGTDRHRDDMWTARARDTYNGYREGYNWGFHSFQKVEGYLSEPLSALWLRGPFLHNGSVPTVADLLRPPAERPATFLIGSIVVDPVHIGFVSGPCTPGATLSGTCFDTSLPGNSNAGHSYGTGLPQEDKKALLAYLLTL